MRCFELVSSFEPAGGQGQAIEALAKGVVAGGKPQTPRGVTGYGKIFTEIERMRLSATRGLM
jgi:excinuclease ABC subunit B